MSEGETIRCQGCGCDMAEDECVISAGQTLCQDCYIAASHRIRVCDPWGERSKKIYRDSHGLSGKEGLTDLQKQIYEFIAERGQVTREEVAASLQLSPTELENEFAILRHCQLLKGKKEGDKIYLVLW
jgi:hypothetical protein